MAPWIICSDIFPSNLGVLSSDILAKTGSGSLNKDMDGDIGELMEEDDDSEEFEDREQFDEFGDILTIDEGGGVKLFRIVP